MKYLKFSAFLLLFSLPLFKPAFASRAVQFTLVNEPSLAINTRAVIDLDNWMIDQSAWQAIFSTATVPAISFSSSSVDPILDVISSTIAASPGFQMYLSTKSGNTVAGGLAVGTTYYVIKIDSSHFQLATSTLNVVRNTDIDITSAGNCVYTLTPVAISGTFSAKWQVSNDGNNWVDMSGPPTISLGETDSATQSFWDFEVNNSKYLGLLMTSPTAGGTNIIVIGNGRKYE